MRLGSGKYNSRFGSFFEPSMGTFRCARAPVQKGRQAPVRGLIFSCTGELLVDRDLHCGSGDPGGANLYSGGSRRRSLWGAEVDLVYAGHAWIASCCYDLRGLSIDEYADG